MFDGAGNHMLFTATGRFDDPEDRVIVGLGAAAGEDDLLRAGADEGGNLFAGGFDRGAGTLTGSVDRSGVSEFRGKIGQHRVEHFRLDGCGGVKIEVDALHKPTHRILLAGRSCFLETATRRLLSREGISNVQTGTDDSGLRVSRGGPAKALLAL